MGVRGQNWGSKEEKIIPNYLDLDDPVHRRGVRTLAGWGVRALVGPSQRPRNVILISL